MELMYWKCKWTGLDRMRTQTGEPLLYSGRENDAHQIGVAMVSRKKATGCLISWSPVNDLILQPPLYRGGRKECLL